MGFIYNLYHHKTNTIHDSSIFSFQIVSRVKSILFAHLLGKLGTVTCAEIYDLSWNSYTFLYYVRFKTCSNRLGTRIIRVVITVPSDSERRCLCGTSLNESRTKLLSRALRRPCVIHSVVARSTKSANSDHLHVPIICRVAVWRTRVPRRIIADRSHCWIEWRCAPRFRRSSERISANVSGQDGNAAAVLVLKRGPPALSPSPPKKK